MTQPKFFVLFFKINFPFNSIIFNYNYWFIYYAWVFFKHNLRDNNRKKRMLAKYKWEEDKRWRINQRFWNSLCNFVRTRSAVLIFLLCRPGGSVWFSTGFSTNSSKKHHTFWVRWWMKSVTNLTRQAVLCWGERLQPFAVNNSVTFEDLQAPTGHVDLGSKWS